MRAQDASSLYLSVLTVGEVRRGVSRVAHRGDDHQASRLASWVDRLVERYAGRILPVDAAVADRWATLGVPDPVPVVDGLIAATALVHDLTVATRKVNDFRSVDVVDPFTS